VKPPLKENGAVESGLIKYVPPLPMSLPKDANCARAKDESRIIVVEMTKEYLVIVINVHGESR